jgi:hypothetical protein
MRQKASASWMVGLFAAVIVAGSGCGTTNLIDPGPGKRVETSLARDSYVAGDQISIRVRNASALSLTYPLAFCKIELQRLENGDWITVQSPEGCALALAYMAPYQTVSQVYQLSATLPSGTYRLTMASPQAENSAPEPRLVTSCFQVATNGL